MQITRRLLLQSAVYPLARAQRVTRPSILLMSGWNYYNIGDVAITPGFLRLVQQYIPEARVTVLLHSYPNELGGYLKERFPDLAILPMEFKAGVPLSQPMEQAFADADLLVLNSGMTLSYGYYGLEWERYIPRMLAFLKARENRLPYGVYGQSFDRVEPQADILYRDVFRTAAFVYTRDSESLALLRKRGVACPEIGFTPDSTFAFNLRDDAAATEFRKRHQLEPGRFVAVVPRLDVSRFRNDGREKIDAEQTRAVIERYVASAREPVVLVHEVTRAIEPVKTMVFDPLSEEAKRWVRYHPDYWMPDAAQSVYASARAVVSMEMHSVILGLAAGTPSIHPFFGEAGLKQWMMRDIGLPQWLMDQDQVYAAGISDAMLAIYRDSADARARTAAAMDRVRRRQGETMARVRRACMEHFERR